MVNKFNIILSGQKFDLFWFQRNDSFCLRCMVLFCQKSVPVLSESVYLRSGPVTLGLSARRAPDGSDSSSQSELLRLQVPGNRVRDAEVAGSGPGQRQCQSGRLGSHNSAVSLPCVFAATATGKCPGAGLDRQSLRA